MVLFFTKLQLEIHSSAVIKCPKGTGRAWFKRAWWVFGKTKGILNGNDVDILFKKKIQEQISNLYRKIYSRLSNQILNAF